MRILRAGRVKLPARIILSLLPLLSPIAAGALPDTGPLLRRAASLSLWNDPYWRKLLYYEHTLLGGFRSPCSNPNFFLSAGGKADPRGELSAAINGLSYSGPDNDSPECRFPERYNWLRSRLGVSAAEYPVRNCTDFEEWKAVLQPESVG